MSVTARAAGLGARPASRRKGRAHRDTVVRLSAEPQHTDREDAHHG
ncbi:hypothetical protein Q9R29_02500 [Rothia sp. ARF10]|nr:hypothetical protein [Rothia sp. ARF10]